ncbi:MAG TPA: hypothetical protein VMT36_09215, partial [Candidatus Saccharimonadia bacterium]|nr:hypothetical protein [Candidatus Saccharimonadia bacterium]
RGRSERRPIRPASQLEAAEVAAEDIIEGRPAAAANEIERAAATQPRGARGRPNTLLATRAAEEYVYVAQDLRRIGLVAILLFGILFGLWIAIEALGLFGQ